MPLICAVYLTVFNSHQVDKFPNAAIPSLLESERRFDTKGNLSHT